MNFNLFIFYIKRQRVLKLIRQHFDNLKYSIESSNRYFNWAKRKEKLIKIARKLKINDNLIIKQIKLSSQQDLENYKNDVK